MSKQSINLLIPKEQDSPTFHRIKIILPLISIISLVLFILLFSISFIYLNISSLRFNQLKKRAENSESKISAQKSTEGVYLFTTKRVDTIAQILSSSKNFSRVISEIIGLPIEGIAIKDVSFDKQGNLSFSLISSSIDTLDNFILVLLAKENNHLYSNIKADGITRDKKANYYVNISLKFDQSYLK